MQSRTSLSALPKVVSVGCSREVLKLSSHVFEAQVLLAVTPTSPQVHRDRWRCAWLVGMRDRPSNAHLLRVALAQEEIWRSVGSDACVCTRLRGCSWVSLCSSLLLHARGALATARPRVRASGWNGASVVCARVLDWLVLRIVLRLRTSVVRRLARPHHWAAMSRSNHVAEGIPTVSGIRSSRGSV